MSTMKHYIRNLEGEFWCPLFGWAPRTDKTCHFELDEYISLDDLVAFYMKEYKNSVDEFPLLGPAGMHVYVEISDEYNY